MWRPASHWPCCLRCLIVAGRLCCILASNFGGHGVAIRCRATVDTDWHIRKSLQQLPFDADQYCGWCSRRNFSNRFIHGISDNTLPSNFDSVGQTRIIFLAVLQLVPNWFARWCGFTSHTPRFYGARMVPNCLLGLYWSSEHFWTGCPSCRPPMTHHEATNIGRHIV